MGVGLLLIFRETPPLRMRALGLAVVGVCWWATATIVGGGAGSELGVHYGYLLDGSSRTHVLLASILVGLLHHPSAALDRVPAAFGSMWGSLSIGGILGLFSPMAFLTWLNALEVGLGVQEWVGWPYASAGSMAEMPWQMMPTLILEPLLTVLVLASLQRRPSHLGHIVRRVTPSVLAVLVVNAFIWTVVWMPKVVASFDLTPPATVSALNQMEGRIPASNEVVASLGVIGRMGYRRYVYATVFGSADTSIPLRTTNVDFLITPVSGQETNGVDLEALTSFLMQQPNAVLVERRDNVWLFELHRQPGEDRLVIRYGSSNIVGGALPTKDGTDTQLGWPKRNCLASDASSSGYLFTGFHNELAPGTYVLTMLVEGSSRMVVSVRDNDTRQILGQRPDQADPGPAHGPYAFRRLLLGPDTNRRGVGSLSFVLPRSPGERRDPGRPLG